MWVTEWPEHKIKISISLVEHIDAIKHRAMCKQIIYIITSTCQSYCNLIHINRVPRQNHITHMYFLVTKGIIQHWGMSYVKPNGKKYYRALLLRHGRCLSSSCWISLTPMFHTRKSRSTNVEKQYGWPIKHYDWWRNKKGQLSLTNPRDACETFARFM